MSGFPAEVSTVIITVAISLNPSLSVTCKIAVYVPAAPYVQSLVPELIDV
ncbi:MAG: hypothetical protein HYV48_01770 [Candidatus Omnitrophica bacterium]|nr:hypothetical protein [Candidatus Omnitrophota bacterium]